MGSMLFRSLRWAAPLACGIAGSPAGCAQERAPINRVQANALDKHFFVGSSLSDPSDDPEFYMGHRVIDEPFGVGQGFWMFQGTGSIARIKWEIQEDKLVGRLTYERVQAADRHGSRKTDDGQVVAMFKVQSHFDIKRDYNPQTGEELNVIVENTTDRPWYEREYFRVDWSANLVTDAYDFDLLALGAAIDGVKYDPLSYYVEDPQSPDAPVFSDADGYFDVTTKIFATPQIVRTPYGSLPVCFVFGSYPAITCNPAEVKIRLAFKKIVDDDYEPLDWDGKRMDAFGWFSVERFGYERNYGILDQKWRRFAARFNIWQKSHVPGTQCAIDAWRDDSGQAQNYRVDAGGNTVFDPRTGLPIPDPLGRPFTRSAPGQDVHRDFDGDGTEDECQFWDEDGNVVHRGSRCDEFNNRCDIPLYERATKTIPMYYGPSAPADLFASTWAALNSWNIAVKRAVQLGKVVEADRVGKDIGQGDMVTSEDDLRADQQAPGGATVPEIFTLCHNPVTGGDHPACGKPGLSARLGDLRYHFVDVIRGAQAPSAWGIMTDFDDPLTGEKVQASINEWEYVLDIASQNVEDILRWINAEITNDQIANGQYMSQWLAATRLNASPYQPAVLSTREIEQRIASIDRSAGKLAASAPKNIAPGVAAQMAASSLAATLGPSLDAQFEAARQKLLGTEWEARLVTPEMLQMAGLDPTQPFAGDPATLERASPLRGLNPALRRWTKQVRTRATVLKNMCVLEEQPEPDSLVGLARQAAKMFPLPDTKDASYAAEKFARDQALHQWIREAFHLSVIAHEMGHSMGLRHNFTGSWDALNYHTEYWQLRTRNGKEKACPDAVTPHTNGADCVGPRWIDPLTEQETNGLIWKWASSTVMDYPGDQTQDTNDIGPYDKAAMRFGYADIVDVERSMRVGIYGGVTGGEPGYDLIGSIQLGDGFGGIFGNSYGMTFAGGGGNHYSQYNDLYHVLGDCGRQRPGWSGDPDDPLARQCSGSDLGYVARRDMRDIPKLSPADAARSPQNVARFAVDKQGHPRHPYMFGSDEFADFGNVPVFRFDAGADAYEQTQFLVSTYENRYIFNNFRRNRVTFTTLRTVAAIEDRYWDKIQAGAKSLALGIELFDQPGQPDQTRNPGGLMPLALGAADGLAMFVRAMTRPEPGQYYVATRSSPGGPPNDWASTYGYSGQPIGPQIALGDGEGRFLHNDYDYTQGYWWADYQTQVGSFYEKRLAPEYLTEAYNRFISNSKDDYIDGRYKNLSYASIYPNQIRRIFANLMATQSATLSLDLGSAAQIFTVAPYTVPTSGGVGVSQVQYLPWYKYDPKDPSTTQLAYPKGAVLLDPLVGWEQQYPALVNLFVFGPSSLSMDLVDQMRIFSPGDAASLSIPADQLVRYRDPLTGIEYVARNYGTESVNPDIGFATAKTIGARMVQHANYLAKKAYGVASEDSRTGELTYKTDGQGNPVPNDGQPAQDAATMLRSYAGNLDVVRQLTLLFGYGPLGHGG